MSVPPKPKRQSQLFFLKQYFRKPSGIGAVAPSSRRLAQLMVASVDPKPHEIIVELGPGTGVFTRELLARGVAPANLVLVEFNTQFAAWLRADFPDLRVVEGDARDLPKILAGLGIPVADKIISGIPLRSMKPDIRKVIAAAIASSLKPGGRLVQFSYFNALPLTRIVAAEVGLTGHRTGIVLGNMPPAFVWRYDKVSEGSGIY